LIAAPVLLALFKARNARPTYGPERDR